MTNAVFDMNNMLFRSLFVLGGFGTKAYTFEPQQELDELMRKLAMDISHLIRLINPSRVIFALDDKSWRKKIFIEENDGYKANREKSTMINFDNVFHILDEFMDIMQDTGAIITKIKNAEGDDTIALWRDELLYKQKQHVILISGDEDVRQLVTSSIDEKGKPIFATVFNPFMQGKNAAKKLYVPENIFNTWINDVEESSIWDMSAKIDIDKGDFNRIRNTEKVRVEEINGNHIAMKKVFCGDDGDNIPAIYTWDSTTAKGDPKVVRITNSKFEKIYEGLRREPNEKIDHLILLERSKEIFQYIAKVAKHKPSFDIDKRLERQIKLVVLDKNFFPPRILEDFNKFKEDELSRPRPDISNLNLNTILAGTRYVTTKGRVTSGTEASIFKEIDKLSTNKQLF